MQEYEKAILVGVYLHNESKEKTEYSLEELERLADTANAKVELIFTQQRTHIDSAWYIGKGKVLELASVVDELNVDLVIFNTELTPSQVRNIESIVDCKVIDRTQLILDIFAQRAQSREGKIQVELAQLNYLLPRLSGKGTSLSRLGGGIGTRGPGETKLESDRRHIRKRISEMTQHLKEMIKHRELYRKRRKKNDIYQVALVGYTNAGKSTLLNSLSGSDIFAEDKLFATLDPTSRKVMLHNGKNIIVTDTVGFIQDLPHDLVAAFRSTLEEAKEANLLLHVVDSSHPYKYEQVKVVEELLVEIQAHTIPRITVFNKADISDDRVVDAEGESIFISAFNLNDKERLLALIERKLLESWEEYHFQIPASRGDLLAFFHEKGNLLAENKWDDIEQVWDVKVELDTYYLNDDLRKYLVLS